MPLSGYFSGAGGKVMRNMKAQYGKAKGERVFHATANKKKKKKSKASPPRVGGMAVGMGGY
jgi:hypothetical protein